MQEQKKGALTFIFITMLIDVMGFGIVIPVFPKLIQHLTQSDLSHAAQIGGWLMFAYSFVQFFFSPILGGLSDQYGRRPVILASLFGFGLDYILLGFAPSIGWLFLGRVIAGITGASFTAAGAYIADVSTPEKRAQNFGLIGAAFGLGFILGPAVGGALAQLGEWLTATYPDGHFMGFSAAYWGVRLPFFGSAALSLINWLYGFFVLPESLSPANRRTFDWKRANPIGSLQQLRSHPLIWGMVLPLVLIYIAGYSQQSVWTYFTILKFGWSEGMVALSLTFVGLMAAIVQGGLTRVLIPKWGAQKAIFIGLTLYALGFVLYALANQSWMMFAITVIASMGGISMPAIQALMSNEVEANAQGELRGGLTSLMSLTSVAGPLIMSYLFSYFTAATAPIYLPGAPYWMAALLVIASLLLIQSLLKKYKT